MSAVLLVASMIAFAGAVTIAAARFLSPGGTKGYALPGALLLVYAVLFGLWIVIP
ncbi:MULTISPECIES: histidine kinase [Nocardiopsidaceae]|jgi:uncharacterized membrane protein YedE/YeeE|uniref:Histidine kinase n=2 Tax=Nocardiopsidaceae TaxID=83676 RepID=A0ABY6YGY0_9ACTN|nr:histidine kinase [Streptomonospora nanhaiensis]MEE2045346.1 histidine kinase [Nocardiopsis tropica]WAE71474.1 histidine kinase [Streptomonospora nanhaiensis]